MTQLNNTKKIAAFMIIVTGAAVGIAAVLLARLGNPPNMGICSACFQRDTAGGLGLFSGPGPLQYLRPEIPGFLLGAFGAALLFGKFRSRGGSSPALRFVIGAFMMVGALVFLGCPIRLMDRLAAGDYAAGGVGLLGLLAGIAFGSFCIRRGFSLGPIRDMKPLSAAVVPLLGAGLLVYILVLALGAGGDPRGVLETKFHAPLLASLGAGLVLGFLGQRSRFCSTGGFRDLILWRDATLFKGYIALIVVVVAGNLLVDLFWPCPGERKLFEWGAAPLAHSVHLWNFLGMALVGLGATLVGGCPFRQMIASSQGNSDAAMTLMGLLFGAAFCHNFALAAAPAKPDALGGPGTAGMVAVIVGIVVLGGIGLICSDRKA